jgi:hypothetical protein
LYARKYLDLSQHLDDPEQLERLYRVSPLAFERALSELDAAHVLVRAWRARLAPAAAAGPAVSWGKVQDRDSLAVLYAMLLATALLVTLMLLQTGERPARRGLLLLACAIAGLSIAVDSIGRRSGCSCFLYCFGLAECFRGAEPYVGQ